MTTHKKIIPVPEQSDCVFLALITLIVVGFWVAAFFTPIGIIEYLGLDRSWGAALTMVSALIYSLTIVGSLWIGRLR